MFIDHRAIRAALAAAAIAAGAPAAADTAQAPSLKFDGRLHLHHDSFDGVYSNDGARRSATYPRRARLGVSGRLPWQLKVAVDVDFGRGGVTTLRTAALAWSGLGGGE
jgi:phosphate-selective porin